MSTWKTLLPSHRYVRELHMIMEEVDFSSVIGVITCGYISFYKAESQ